MLLLSSKKIRALCVERAGKNTRQTIILTTVLHVRFEGEADAEGQKSQHDAKEHYESQ